MKIASLGIAVALGAAPVVVHAQVTVSGGVSFNFGSLPGEPVADTAVFYDQLSPYGTWVDDPVVGEAFIPDQTGYVPYTNGHWEDTDVGFVWVSTEPFGWATSHYGRWWFSNDYGRWVWVPDTTWGPSWVDWYESDGVFGWAPLAPDIVIQAGYQVPIDAYHYVPGDHLFDADARNYYVPRDRVEVLQRQARPVGHTENVDGRRIVTGPAPERLRAQNIRVQPKRITNPKQLGVLDRAQARTIEQRAKERKPQLQQQNQKRLEQHADIKRAVETRASKAPEMKRNETTRPETRTPARPEKGTEPARPENRTQPTRPETRTPTRPETRTQPERTTRPEPRPETTRPEPERTTPPARNERPEPTPRPEPQRTEPTRPEPQRTEPTPRPEPQRAEPPRPEPKAEHPQPKGNAEGKDKRNEH